MKKLSKRITAIALALLAVLMLSSCSILRFPKQEIEDGSKWEYYGVQRITSEQGDASLAQTYSSTYTGEYHMTAWSGDEDEKTVIQYIDYIVFEDGKAMHHHFKEKGTFYSENGEGGYEGAEEVVEEIGTYSGKDVTLSLKDCTEAFVYDDMLIVKIEKETPALGTFSCELVFKPVEK